MLTRLQGTWEEIATHADELRGKQLIVTVVGSESPVEAAAEDQRREAMLALFNEADQLSFTPPPLRKKPDEFGDILIEKFRKQGLDL